MEVLKQRKVLYEFFKEMPKIGIIDKFDYHLIFRANFNKENKER